MPWRTPRSVSGPPPERSEADDDDPAGPCPAANENEEGEEEIPNRAWLCELIRDALEAELFSSMLDEEEEEDRAASLLAPGRSPKVLRRLP